NQRFPPLNPLHHRPSSPTRKTGLPGTMNHLLHQPCRGFSLFPSEGERAGVRGSFLPPCPPSDCTPEISRPSAKSRPRIPRRHPQAVRAELLLFHRRENPTKKIWQW